MSQLDLWTKPVLTQASPGKFVPAQPDQVPDMILAHVVDNGDGTYKLVPDTSDWLKLDLQGLTLLGMPRQKDTILRLGSAGFIEVCKVSPQIYLLNLTSWYNHLRRVMEVQAKGDDFWHPELPNLKVYRESMRV